MLEKDRNPRQPRLSRPSKRLWLDEEHLVIPVNYWEDKMKLNIKAFALACGIVWGLGLLFLTWWIMIFEGATGEPTIIGMIYRGYRVSLSGSFIGLGWAFLDGLVGGAVFAWLYNRLIHDKTAQKA
jgi:hypothetical protein